MFTPKLKGSVMGKTEVSLSLLNSLLDVYHGIKHDASATVLTKFTLVSKHRAPRPETVWFYWYLKDKIIIILYIMKSDHWEARVLYNQWYSNTDHILFSPKDSFLPGVSIDVLLHCTETEGEMQIILQIT